MTSLASVVFEIRPDGWIHLDVGPWDAFQTPVGVLLFAAFAPLLRWVPLRTVPHYLVVTSLFLALVTVGMNYALFVLALAVLALLVTRTSERAVYCYKLAPKPVIAVSVCVLSVCYAALVWIPQPSFLPPVAEPLYFYLQWAGVGYLYLRAVHVLVDRCNSSYEGPKAISVVRGQDYLAYMLFAPTLRMGPLYRYNEFVDQLRSQKVNQNAHNLGAGLIRIFVGFVRLGVMMALAHPVLYPMMPLESDPGWLYPVFNIAPETMPYWHVYLCVCVQVMRSFLWMSGYFDLAIGVGLLCGFTVPENFNYPWIASSIRTFWRRWHLTLGLWLRDYIFIPLGGSRRLVWRNYFLTFLFCGLWHGVYPSYICWGISQGVGLTVNRYWRLYWDRKRDQNHPVYAGLRSVGLADRPLGRALAWVCTFNFQVLTLAWFLDEQHLGLRFIPVLLGFDPIR